VTGAKPVGMLTIAVDPPTTTVYPGTMKDDMATAADWLSVYMITEEVAAAADAMPVASSRGDVKYSVAEVDD